MKEWNRLQRQFCQGLKSSARTQCLCSVPLPHCPHPEHHISPWGCQLMLMGPVKLQQGWPPAPTAVPYLAMDPAELGSHFGSSWACPQTVLRDVPNAQGWDFLSVPTTVLFLAGVPRLHLPQQVGKILGGRTGTDMQGQRDIPYHIILCSSIRVHEKEEEGGIFMVILLVLPSNFTHAKVLLSWNRLSICLLMLSSEWIHYFS